MDTKNKCSNCPKDTHCCVFEKNKGFVFVGIKDAEKIMKRIKQEYSYFLDYSPLPKSVVKILKNDDKLAEGGLRYSQLDKNGSLLRLKKHKNGKCIFLNQKNLCEIYNIRPNICRIYPYWAIKLINGKIKIIPHDFESNCKLIKSNIKKQKDIKQIISKKESAEIKRTFKKIIEEDKYYKKNIKKFVKNSDSQ